MTSPAGVFKYPKLSEVDYGTDQYPKKDGEYSTRLVLPADSNEAKAFVKALEVHVKNAMAYADEEFAKLPVASRKKLGKPKMADLFTVVYDKETEQPTGEIEFKFSMKAGGEIKRGPRQGQRWSRKPVIFDSQGNRLDPVPAIWSGTVGKVRFQISPYFIAAEGKGGLSFRLVAAQIKELVTAGESRGAADMGFDTDGDGYVAPPKTAAETAGFAAEDNDDESADF